MTVSPTSASNPSKTPSDKTPSDKTPSGKTPSGKMLSEATVLELAQMLAAKLAIQPNDWHRLNSNRQVRAKEQAAAALVYLLKDQPEESRVRLEQAVGWLDRSLKAPPCPTHGHRGSVR